MGGFQEFISVLERCGPNQYGGHCTNMGVKKTSKYILTVYD